MFKTVVKHKVAIVLWVMILVYIGYFSVFTILRYRTLYAHYFDLGIMHQTVYNTYQALRLGDMDRILELTNPFGSNQITRMAIHNDILLAFIAPFYFIHSGPETLLIIQSIILALGGWAIFKITTHVFKDKIYHNALGLVFTFAYLMYTPMQRANNFDFHAVTLTTTLLLFMFYYWLVGKYRFSVFFFVLSLLAKEQVALTTLFFGLFTLIRPGVKKHTHKTNYSLLIIASSIIWFALSMKIIIPFFRGGNHFALEYYTDLKNLPHYIFHVDTYRYFLFLMGPLAFLSLFSPLHFLIALPEFGINLLSNSWNMRNIVFHYTSVIQPFVFIAAIYGAKNLLIAKSRVIKKETAHKNRIRILMGFILVCTLLFSYFKGPLPYSLEKEIHPFLYPQKESIDAIYWGSLLENPQIKVSATGHIAPLFTSRIYFYTFSENYYLADYVIISVSEATYGWEKDKTKLSYEQLVNDSRFRMVYKNENLEIYKKK